MRCASSVAESCQISLINDPPMKCAQQSCAERAHAVLTVTLRLAVDASISEQRQLGG
jgi:hypothetical protein